jgi:hypothetical protein
MGRGWQRAGGDIDMFYKNEKDKVCPTCKQTYSTMLVNMKYCTPICAAIARKIKQESYRKKMERNNVLKFGIKETDPTKLTFKCATCKIKFTRHKSQVKYRGAKYCSVECRSRGQKRINPSTMMTLWSEVVKLYDNNKCAYCGKTTYLNSHHIFSRTNRSTKYDLNNGITLCAGHHTLSSTFSAHKTPAEFIEWIKEKRGIKWYEELRARAKTMVKSNKSLDELVYFNLLEIKSHLAEAKEL